MATDWRMEAKERFDLALDVWDRHGADSPHGVYLERAKVSALIDIAESLREMRPQHSITQHGSRLYCQRCGKPFGSLIEAAEHYRDHNIAKNNGG